MAKSTKEPKDQAKKTPSSNEDTPQTAEVTASAEQTPSDHVPDKWPLEADRLALHSPLAECLRLVAGHYGRRTSFSSLTAGLPIPKEGMSPEIFMRAAERADMNAKLVERPLEALAVAPTLPCILVLKNKQACILWDIEYPDKTPPLQEPGQEAQIHPETRFLVQFPETEEEKQIMGLEQLKALYTDYAFFVRPVARSDDRAGPSEINTARDWFWGVLKKNKRIYQEVVLAAVMINIFALASPLFIMNVYDRVVPNAAFDTLWVLAAGVLIVYVFDFILKNLRAHFLDIAGRKADIKISAQLFEQIMGMTMASRPASAGVLASNMREF
ncbi:MAG: ABC transporter transmembrane domain-containing protein, partial [Pseudomonadota bacterium]|nr:ABC transporter transmembrane domain-containing protein [Pseudomonadota bacterium]